MLRNLIGFAGLTLKYPGFKKEYLQYLKNPYRDRETLEEFQNAELRNIIQYSYRYVPYYRRSLDSLGLSPEDIKTQQDLDRLPIVTKKEIKANPELFCSSAHRKYVVTTTGGSTGVPLRYRLDRETSKKMRLIVERNYASCGYKIGDPMVTIGGGSLVPTSDLKKNIKTFMLNQRIFSSVGIDEDGLRNIYQYICHNHIEYLYGYASSLLIFAEFIVSADLSFEHPLKAIISTSESLMPNQRYVIEKALKTKVFDSYGLFDGNVSAFECEMHQGLHIDYESSILRVVDDRGQSIRNGHGRIIATSLTNYAMPFINYETGDYGEITDAPCICGKKTARLLAIDGRTTDYLKIGDNYVGGPALTVVMGKLDIETYQVIQDRRDHVVFRIVMKDFMNEERQRECADIIMETMNFRVPGAKCAFEFYGKAIDLGIQNKHKFIIRNVDES